MVNGHGQNEKNYTHFYISWGIEAYEKLSIGVGAPQGDYTLKSGEGARLDFRAHHIIIII